MKKHILTFSIIICFSIFSHAQTIGTYKSFLKETATAREHPVDMIHSIIDVKFDCAKGEVIGKVTHQFRPLQKMVDSIFLDAPGIEITDSKLAGEIVKFKSNDKGVTLYFSPALPWDFDYTLEISYKAKPARGLYFIGWHAKGFFAES